VADVIKLPVRKINGTAACDHPLAAAVRIVRNLENSMGALL
jgi:hypothetical protein